MNKFCTLCGREYGYSPQYDYRPRDTCAECTAEKLGINANDLLIVEYALKNERDPVLAIVEAYHDTGLADITDIAKRIADAVVAFHGGGKC